MIFDYKQTNNVVLHNLGIQLVRVEHSEFDGKCAVIGNDGKGKLPLESVVRLDVFDPSLVVLDRID